MPLSFQHFSNRFGKRSLSLLQLKRRDYSFLSLPSWLFSIQGALLEKNCLMWKHHVECWLVRATSKWMDAMCPFRRFFEEDLPRTMMAEDTIMAHGLTISLEHRYAIQLCWGSHSACLLSWLHHSTSLLGIECHAMPPSGSFLERVSHPAGFAVAIALFSCTALDTAPPLSYGPPHCLTFPAG